jgi:peptidoglycan glycosyltransferase
VNAPLRRVGIVVLVLFALLFANLNYVQAYKADDYRNNEHNSRVQAAEYNRQRGSIEIGRGIVLAESKATADELKYLRTYPGSTEYAHIVGYRPVQGSATGIEKLEDAWLSGNADAQVADRWLGLITGEQSAGGIVQSTLLPSVQDAAMKQLAANNNHVTMGAAVALDPKTGAILASVSMPSFDPNPLASHSSGAAQKVYNQLNADPTKPLLNRAFQERYPPGSTFKVIDSAVALSNGLTPDTAITGGDTYSPPDTTHIIKNASGENCPDQLSLIDALTISCNTAFSRLCVEQLGAKKIGDMAKAFGFGAAPKLDHDDKNVFGVVSSETGQLTNSGGQDDKPTLAQSCIGQSNVQMTPLQGALMAATVANGGQQMRPYVVDKELGADRTTVSYTAAPHQLNEPISGQVAGNLQQMMLSVVQHGTATKAQIRGYDVGGKTGTAENGEAANEHGWFIGFTLKDGQPIAAVAVFLYQAGRGGSSEASRIGGEIMKAVIAERGSK